MNKHPLNISVIIPVYNAERYLQECLDSILIQDFDSFEIICVDDGSTDGSLELLKSYASKHKNMHVYNQCRRGPGAARNLGLDHAVGKYIYFLDSDDMLRERSSLTYMFKEMEDNKLSMLCFDTEVFFENQQIQKTHAGEKKYFARIREYGFYENGYDLFVAMQKNKDYTTVVWEQCVDRDFLLSQHIRFPDGFPHEDGLYTFEVMLLAKRVKHVSRKLHKRRVRPNSVITSHPGFRDFHGNMHVWIKMLDFWRNNSFPEYVDECVDVYIDQRREYAYSEYKGLYKHDVEKIALMKRPERKLLDIFLKSCDIRSVHSAGERISYKRYFPFHLVEKDSRIIIYGAGDVGKEFYNQCKQERHIKLVGIVDKNYRDISFLGVEVWPVEKLMELEYDYVLIAIENEEIAKEVKDNLVNMGVMDSCIKWDGKSYSASGFNEHIILPLMRFFN